jgi:NAD(P)-dependent dehydrogenase (short-subunit alcohol dehydrogenase family)
MAIVTGAGAGIGRAIAHKFAANGASVCLLDISQTQAETVATEITRSGGTASAYECDVTDRGSIESTFHTILQQGRVHILVNNAASRTLVRPKARPSRTSTAFFALT